MNSVGFGMNSVDLRVDSDGYGVDSVGGGVDSVGAGFKPLNEQMKDTESAFFRRWAEFVLGHRALCLILVLIIIRAVEESCSVAHCCEEEGEDDG